MKEPVVDLELALEHGLTKKEYQRILTILGRTPTFTELGVFSVMWSEHCSYKNSISVLKTLPRDGEHLLVKAGEENAGLVDIGDGLAVAFKIESHNHPSAIEPYQGAATGVGGILRDIFTMGARPIAALNSLRFGNLDDAHVRYLLDGVVNGIADYGNCFGVPTIGGEVYFDESYAGNPLVNCMAVGIVKHDGVATAVAQEAGSPVMLIGSATGRDGIHGATFASEEISDGSQKKRPQVQVGDPFTEKLLLEATLELIKEDLIVGIQDMGAAGITCSSCEMAAKGESGMTIELAKVPVREPGMTPYEIMLSESQERMLVVAKQGREERVREICEKWDLHAVSIGKVNSGTTLSIMFEGKTVADLPADPLALGGGAPVYTRESTRPAYLEKTLAFDAGVLPEPDDYNAVLVRLLASPNIAGKEWVYRQYDHMVRSNSVVLPGSDAGVVRIKGTRRALALSTDCNGRYVYLNPRTGGQIAVAEAARNVVCAGAKPLAITNCLNFGNPYKPEIYWQFKEAVAGMGEACQVLGTPVTGGNVSFYNENPNGAVYPTPVVGMLGLVEDLEHVTTAWFKTGGDVVILLGNTCGHIGGSEYLYLTTGEVAGDAPALNLEAERELQACCLELIRAGFIKSAHDASEGGLAVALAESCFLNPRCGLGIKAEVNIAGRPDFYLFGEDQSRIVVSAAAQDVDAILRKAEARAVPATVIGTVIETPHININQFISAEISELKDRHRFSLHRKMET